MIFLKRKNLGDKKKKEQNRKCRLSELIKAFDFKIKKTVTCDRMSERVNG